MKRILSSMLVVAMAFASTVAKADNISLEQAKEAAVHFYVHNTYYTDVRVSDLVLVHYTVNPDLDVPSEYVFNVRDYGWIAMAATTVIDPVVAFSDEKPLDFEDVSPAMLWWLNGYADMVSEIQVLDAENDYPDSQEWIALKNKLLKGNTKANQHVLMQEKWGQGDAQNPDYNYYCPTLNGGTCIVGCVATALAQICHYYKYPVQPRGNALYSWPTGGRTLKLGFDTIQFNYSIDQVKAVALLSWAAGMAVKMDYGTDGSGALMQNISSGMSSKFKLTSSSLVFRNGNSDTSFVGKIRRQLMNNDVVCMGGNSPSGGGVDAGGHAWVACGYFENNEGMIYMNWGWHGSGDGFFNLKTNNMAISGSGYNFNSGQEAVIGMLPPEDSNIRHDHVGIEPVVANSLLGSAYPNPASVAVHLPYTSTVAGEMCVYSIDGKLVERRSVSAGSGNVTLKVDNLPAGIYVYRMNNATGKFVVK